MSEFITTGGGISKTRVQVQDGAFSMGFNKNYHVVKGKIKEKT